MAVRDERQLRRTLAGLAARLYEGGFVVATGGSLSARLGNNAYLLTAYFQE